MNRLFTLDLENYDSLWAHSKRDSSRGIIALHNGGNPNFTPETQLALVFVSKKNYYKFPGGGIEVGENKEEALVREVGEETGLRIIPSSIREYGSVLRLQKSTKIENAVFDQESFYYICSVEEKAGASNLDEYERKDGFELRTVTIKEAIEVNRNFKSENTFDLEMCVRDMNVLQHLAGLPVEPSRAYADYLLEVGHLHNPGPWREHSYAVDRAAEKVASAINANGGSMDPQRAYISGVLHDIGRKVGHTFMSHVIDGYDYLHKFSYDRYAMICITHSFHVKNPDTDYIGKRDLSEERQNQIRRLLESKEYDDYDMLIQLLDSTCNANGINNLILRMEDVKARYGVYPQQKWDRNLELKSYFESLMGKDLYSII